MSALGPKETAATRRTVGRAERHMPGQRSLGDATSWSVLGEDVAAQEDIARAAELGVDLRWLEDAVEQVKALR